MVGGSQPLVVGRLEIPIDADGRVRRMSTRSFAMEIRLTRRAAPSLNYLSLASRQADPRCLMTAFQPFR
jgi:hypothetical protein